MTRPDGAETTLYSDDLFDTLMALPEDERDAEAAARCGGDRSLLREVRALLRAHVNEPGQRRRGDRLGRYRLEACLGSGTSGAVWTAFDEHLATWTALKIFHAGRAAASLEPVLREARAASAILSDHVVRIKAAGRFDDDGPFYIEMLLCAEQHTQADGTDRLVVGTSLGEEAPASIEETVRLVAEAARGVEAAHRVGVVHRDVKPANILVTPVSRRALVADFGLSSPVLYPSAAGRSGTHSVSLVVADRAIVGTPCYMAPEVALGQGATRASDVYGLGATLFALLGGHPPYVLPEEVVDALTVVGRVRGGPPESLAAIAPKVPRRLIRIVQAAMARDPGHRYPSAGALADDLDAWRLHHTVSVDRLKPIVGAALFVRRKLSLVATAGVLVAVVVLAVGSLVAMNQVRHELIRETQSALLHKVAADVAAIRADGGLRAASVLAGEARLGAEEAARGAAGAAQQAAVARHEVEEVTAWADTERAAALEAVARATDAAAAAGTRLVEMQILVNRAEEERAVARTELLGAQRRLAVSSDVIAQLQASLERERLEQAQLEERVSALRAERDALERRLAALPAP